MANQYELDKARELLTMFECESLIDVVSASLPRYLLRNWRLVEFKQQETAYDSTSFWKFRYGRRRFFCHLTVNCYDIVSYVNFEDPEKYEEIERQIKRYAQYM
jgi:hypothetical protein